jgi:hypothetical protein
MTKRGRPPGATSRWRNPNNFAAHHAQVLMELWLDHRVPLFRVWSEHRDLPWPKLLDFWGLPNLQVINRDAHTAKCAIEARHRRVARSLETQLD